MKKGEKVIKRYLIALMVLCGVLSFTGSAWSYTINSGGTDVGSLDDMLYSTLLTTSGDQAEIDWVNSVLGESFTTQDKYDTTTGDWTRVDSDAVGIWALDLNDAPEYFLIKIGTGSLPAETPDHYLFGNNAATDWAVVRLSDLNITKVTGVGRISHIGEFGTQVPEPSTLLLLGSGLVGLGLAGRRFIGRI